MAHVQRKQPEKRASTEILIGGTAHENKRIKTRMVLPERRYLPGKPESSDIYLANLNPFTGSEQGGTRPVLVLQNNDGNFYCPTLIVAPMTTQIKKLNQPTHYLIKNNRALAAPSMVEFEQIKTIDKSRIKGYLGKLTKEQLSEIDDYLKISLGMYIPETVEAP